MYICINKSIYIYICNVTVIWCFQIGDLDSLSLQGLHQLFIWGEASGNCSPQIFQVKKKHTNFHRIHLNHEKTLTTFQYTVCLIGILIMVHYNAYITGEYNVLYTPTNHGFFHCSPGLLFLFLFAVTVIIVFYTSVGEPLPIEWRWWNRWSTGEFCQWVD